MNTASDRMVESGSNQQVLQAFHNIPSPVFFNFLPQNPKRLVMIISVAPTSAPFGLMPTTTIGGASDPAIIMKADTFPYIQIEFVKHGALSQLPWSIFVPVGNAIFSVFTVEFVT